MREMYRDEAAELLCPFGAEFKPCLSRRCMMWKDTIDGLGFCLFTSDVRHVETDPETALTVEICEV
jgi:hypothetical protein